MNSTLPTAVCYNIYYAMVRPDKTVIYTKLADGGFNKIKSGKDTNDYAITCQGKTLSLSPSMAFW